MRQFVTRRDKDGIICVTRKLCYRKDDRAMRAIYNTIQYNTMWVFSAFYTRNRPGCITVVTRKPCCRKETARCRKCSFPLKFANNIHYKYKTSQASKAATLQSSKHAGAKGNLTQNQDSKSIKVTCLESVEKQ